MKTVWYDVFIIISILFTCSCSRHMHEQKPPADTTVMVMPHPVNPSTGSAQQPVGTSGPSPQTQNAGTTVMDTVRGEVYMGGNEPFTRLMLTIGPTSSITLEADSAILKKLRTMQGERIMAIGTMKKSVIGKAIVVKEFQVLR